MQPQALSIPRNKGHFCNRTAPSHLTDSSMDASSCTFPSDVLVASKYRTRDARQVESDDKSVCAAEALRSLLFDSAQLMTQSSKAPVSFIQFFRVLLGMFEFCQALLQMPHNDAEGTKSDCSKLGDICCLQLGAPPCKTHKQGTDIEEWHVQVHVHIWLAAILPEIVLDAQIHTVFLRPFTSFEHPDCSHAPGLPKKFGGIITRRCMCQGHSKMGNLLSH